MRLYDSISYEALEFWFSDMDEHLERDISAVHVLCILYCKNRFLDFSVDVFGANGSDSLPLYSEVIPVESGEVLFAHPISPSFVLGMFDKRILQLFSSKGLSILWNPAWSTSAKIDPLRPDPSVALLPEEN